MLYMSTRELADIVNNYFDQYKLYMQLLKWKSVDLEKTFHKIWEPFHYPMNLLIILKNSEKAIIN